jgi:hypothetical protein
MAERSSARSSRPSWNSPIESAKTSTPPRRTALREPSSPPAATSGCSGTRPGGWKDGLYSKKDWPSVLNLSSLVSCPSWVLLAALLEAFRQVICVILNFPGLLARSAAQELHHLSEAPGNPISLHWCARILNVVMFATPTETDLFTTRMRLSSSIRAFFADPASIRLPNGPPVLRRARLIVPSFLATFHQFHTVPSKRIVGSGRLISDPNRALSTRCVATLPEKDQRGLLVQRRA